MKLNVFVDNERDADSYESKIPAGHEHDRDAEDCSEDREGPVIILETWPPVGSLEEGEQSAGNVDKTVAHQKEHTENMILFIIITWILWTVNSTLLTSEEVQPRQRFR